MLWHEEGEVDQGVDVMLIHSKIIRITLSRVLQNIMLYLVRGISALVYHYPRILFKCKPRTEISKTKYLFGLET